MSDVYRWNWKVPHGRQFFCWDVICSHGFHCLERWQHPHDAWLCLNCFGEGIAEELFRAFRWNIQSLGYIFTSWVCLSCSNILTMVYPFSHNHGFVDNYPKWKETTIGRTYFSLPWLWKEGYILLLLKSKFICLNEKLAEFLARTSEHTKVNHIKSHDLSYFREGMKENEATSQGSATPKLPSINRFLNHMKTWVGYYIGISTLKIADLNLLGIFFLSFPWHVLNISVIFFLEVEE